MDITRYEEAGLHGWKGKLARRAAPRVAERTPLDTRQLKAVLGAVAFAFSFKYVAQTLLAVARTHRR